MPEVAPSLGASRATVGECKRCESIVGEFFNLFHKVSGSSSYYLPALLGSWSSRLKPTGGSPRTASSGTDLESCIIQPLGCPKCGDTLGFHVVETPEREHEYLGRDIFKLPRITLKCEISPGDIQVVRPHVETLPTKTQPLSTNDNETQQRDQSQSPPSHPTSTQTSESPSPPPSPSPSPSPSSSPEMANAEVDSRPPPPRQHDPPELVHRQNPLPPVESNRLPPPIQSPGERPTLPSIGLTQKSPLPARSPAVMPVHRDEPPYAPPLPRDSPAGLANRSRETLPPILHSPSQAHHTNSYPPDLDALGRMQTQISQNTGALSAHARRLQDLQDVSEQQLNSVRREFHDLIHANMSRLGEMITALQRDMQAIQRQVTDLDDAMDNVSRTVSMIQAQGPGAPAGGASAAQAPALELMAQQLHSVSTKANEVDSLKISLEIMKGRIQRLEDGAAAPSTQTVLPHPQYAVTSYGSTPTPATHAGTPVHEHAEAGQPQTFTAVNAPPKRVYSYAEDLPDVDQRSDSSKRLKLATMEPRNTYTVSQPHHSPHEQPLNPEDSHARPQLTQSQSQAHTTSFPSTHTLSHENSIPESTLRSTHPTTTVPSQPSAQPAYYTQDAPSDESWRPIEQRPTRGRPRGGPGSRGGRGRKSLPAQLVNSTPEWERDDWQGAPESQISPNGYYTHGARTARGSSVVRRGSGGAVATAVASTPRGRPSAQYQQQVVNLGMQGVTPGLGSPGSLNGTPIRMMSVGPGQDPYAHTKKTRTKPTRNADGILIRKDGRPDMRSHSSAANLRKVHAKKENAAKERRGSGVWEESASPPVQGTTLQQRDQQGTETPRLVGSPAENAKAAEQRKQADLSDPQTQKHNLIMKSIARGLQDWENIDPGKALRQDREEHVAHPERSAQHLEEQQYQHQHKHHQRGSKGGSRSEKDKENVRTIAVNGGDVGIKREHDERRVILDSQDGDEDMLMSERERDTDGEQDVDMRDRSERGGSRAGGEATRSPSPRSGVKETQFEKERALNGSARDGQRGGAAVVAVAEGEMMRE